MAGKVRKCQCTSEFQDNVYGTGNRYCNSTGKSGGEAKSFKCTVCGKEHSSDTPKEKVIKPSK